MALSSREKIGTIYHLASEQYSFVCSQCDNEFYLFEQFVEHIQIHLHEVLTVFVGADGTTLDRDDAIEVKPHIQCQLEQEDADSIDIKYEALSPSAASDIEDTIDDVQNEIPEKIESRSDHETAPNVNASPDEKPQHEHKMKSLIKCSHCSYECKTRAMLRGHLLVHSDRHDFQCDECPTTLKSKKSLYQHKLRHQRTNGTLPAEKMHKLLRCSYCPFECFQPSTLADHQLVHSDQRSFQCDECPRAFKRKCHLKYHQLSHSGDDHIRSSYTRNSKYACVRCDYKSASKVLLSKHSIKCCGENNVCMQCGQMFVDFHSKMTHAATHEKQFQCEDCGHLCTTKPLLDIHRLSHSDEKNHKCSKCPKAFTNKRALAVHMKHHNSGDQKSPSESNAVIAKCQLCEKEVLRSYMTQHMRSHMHTETKVHRCSICDFEATTNTKLAVHMTKHTDRRDSKCLLCAKSFKSKYDMQKHMSRGHIPPIACQVCEKTVPGGYFDVHMRKHTGEGLFECTQCDNKFVTQNHLTRHMRTHSDQRDFACDLCPKMFKEKHTLVAHRRIHVNDFSFTCQWCGKGFHDKRVYKRHTLSAHKRTWDEKAESN